jgi:hypothetical protein
MKDDNYVPEMQHPCALWRLWRVHYRRTELAENRKNTLLYAQLN